MTKYKHLFSPIKVGKKEIKNRVFMPPISTNLANNGYVTDELVKHYSDRAKGGVGLIVSEVVTVEPVYVYLPGDMSIHDDSYIEGWEKLYDCELHGYGQLFRARKGFGNVVCLRRTLRAYRNQRQVVHAYASGDLYHLCVLHGRGGQQLV